MFFVYIIQSLSDDSFYIGVTGDIEKRLSEHNDGSAKYSSAHRPYRLISYTAFTDKQKALAFEKYLKSGSGFAFRNKHLI
jgi:predicted GIY-YIG superfamily endonuclease